MPSCGMIQSDAQTIRLIKIEYFIIFIGNSIKEKITQNEIHVHKQPDLEQLPDDNTNNCSVRDQNHDDSVNGVATVPTVPSF